MMNTTQKTCAVLLCAGASTRMGFNKMTLRFCGKTPLMLSLEAFDGLVDEAVVAVSEDTYDMANEAAKSAGFPVRIVLGGERRQDSVYNAITATEATIVAIHDCARCLVTREVVAASIASAIENGCGVASVGVYDTVRDVSGEAVDRSRLVAAQTPQSFDRAALIDAYTKTECSKLFTDDAAVYAQAGNKLFYSNGDRMNMKLTTPDDIAVFEALIEKRSEASKEKTMRVGFGEDTHRLKEGRKLILGGVDVPFEFGLDGHSDADVLTHAAIDAALGAAALGDIGMHFPDTDGAYKDINSLILASRAAKAIKARGCRIVNIDATLVAQRPKLAAYRDEMRRNLAEAFGMDVDAVSVKFTTPEYTGPEGRGESMTARAVALIEQH
ncbi:MAG: 2-C-methyl-D-erythritol 2,4-cyclodiphosphate synthase [Clostridia bacterium]|nr:2-C-methyl-D-erythritol 2,4-cyclodiphosphate synthase [Clostridia bacterium]